MGMSVNSELRNFCVRWPAWAFIGWLSLADCFVCQLIWLEMNPDANGCWVAQNSFTTSYRKLMFDQKFISGGTKNRVMSMNVEQQGEGTRLMTCRLKDVNSSLHWILSSFLSETSYQSFLHGLPNLQGHFPSFRSIICASNVACQMFQDVPTGCYPGDRALKECRQPRISQDHTLTLILTVRIIHLFSDWYITIDWRIWEVM